MNIKGKVVQLLDIARGNGKNGGEWVKRDVVIETQDKYPKKICVTVWGEDMVDRSEGLVVGQEIDAHFNLESREYNSRWYTEVKVWKFEFGSNAPQDTVASKDQYDDGGDLPF